MYCSRPLPDIQAAGLPSENDLRRSRDASGFSRPGPPERLQGLRLAGLPIKAFHGGPLNGLGLQGPVGIVPFGRDDAVGLSLTD